MNENLNNNKKNKEIRFLCPSLEFLPQNEGKLLVMAAVFRMSVSWKMMTWHHLIGAYVFAKINATWLVLVGQF